MEVSVLSSSRSALPPLIPAFLGSALLLLAFSHTLGLSLGPFSARLSVGLCILALALLALLLLRLEGTSPYELMILLLPIGLAFFFRVLLLDHATLDYQDFLSQWVEHFRHNGGVAALKDPVGNYNVPYLYLLALLSYLPVPDLYGIKLFSILFDVLLAWGGLRLVKTLTQDRLPSLFAFALLLLLPTVTLNGSCWGQCDSVWAALCLHALASALQNKPIASLSLLALAFAFKLQAIFLIPLWGALWFCGRVKLSHFLTFPGVFALSMAPALLMGKPAGDILRIYLDQAGDSISWQTLNYNSPSLFSLLPYDFQAPPWASKAAVMLAFLFMLGVLAILYVHRAAVDNRALALAGAALALGIPFFLPYMHERYFFLGGVLLAALACVLSFPSSALAAAGAELASLGGYHAYLRQRYFLPISIGNHTWVQLLEGGLMLFALCYTLWALFRQLSSPSK